MHVSLPELICSRKLYYDFNNAVLDASDECGTTLSHFAHPDNYVFADNDEIGPECLWQLGIAGDHGG